MVKVSDLINMRSVAMAKRPKRKAIGETFGVTKQKSARAQLL